MCTLLRYLFVGLDILVYHFFLTFFSISQTKVITYCQTAPLVMGGREHIPKCMCRVNEFPFLVLGCSFLSIMILDPFPGHCKLPFYLPLGWEPCFVFYFHWSWFRAFPFYVLPLIFWQWYYGPGHRDHHSLVFLFIPTFGISIFFFGGGKPGENRSIVL